MLYLNENQKISTLDWSEKRKWLWGFALQGEDWWQEEQGGEEELTSRGGKAQRGCVIESCGEALFVCL